MQLPKGGVVIRPVLEAATGALLIAAAALLLLPGLAGPDGVLTLMYRGCPSGLRGWLSDVYPPYLAHVEIAARLGIASAALFIGAWFAVGVLAAYPTWRNDFLALTSLLLIGAVVLFMVVI